MGRPLTGKKHVGIRRDTRPNGDVYVYERVTGYDAKTQKTKTISTRLLGKILAGTTEMIPTRPKKSRSEVVEPPVEAVRTHVGLQKILEWAGKESGIDEDLKTCFEIGDAQKLSSIARYWVATDGDTLPRMETWQMMNPLPYEYPITQDVYGKLFASVGRNESGVQAYFRNRAQRVSSSGLNLALDTTTFSTYSKNQIEARQGFNKDGDGLDTIKLLVLYSVENREPVAFSKQPGNIPDKISLANSLRQLEVLGLSAPVIVADNGFYCQANMTYLAREHVKFLMLANSTDKCFVKKLMLFAKRLALSKIPVRLMSVSMPSCVVASTISASFVSARAATTKQDRLKHSPGDCMFMFVTSRKQLRFKKDVSRRAFFQSRKIWKMVLKNSDLPPRS